MINKLFRKSERDLLNYLVTALSYQYKYKDMIFNHDYIYAKGNIPILLVAHLDTVHETLPKQIFHDKNQNVLWSPQGLGADDRAGVWGILQLISQKKKPYILFTTKEEVGGIGAYSAINNIKEIPPVNLIIELDRRGSNDAVFYDCDNPEFTSYIESFGFKETWGTFSDISILCPKWGIAGVNLSTGYYNAHTKEEYLRIDELNNVISKIRNIFNNLPEEVFEYIEDKRYSAYGYYNTLFYCTECDSFLNYYNESKIFNVCIDCYNKAFETTNKKPKRVVSIKKYKRK